VDIDTGELDITVTGFDLSEIENMVNFYNPPGKDGTGTGEGPGDGAGPGDDTTVLANVPRRVKEGDFWQLGRHRLYCGDCRKISDLQVLFDDQRAAVIHADPPYGMGKEKDGVQNDNLYEERLDAFQLEWIAAWLPFLKDKGSLYIWGNAPDLWRLWYGYHRPETEAKDIIQKKALRDLEPLTLRNELVWDKDTIAGMNSPLMTQYPEATERCLFIQRGNQLLGNINQDNYWPGWDEVRLYLEGEAEAVGLTPKKTKEATGVQMYSHWFTRSQWAFIPEEYYNKLREKYPDNFGADYLELRKKYEELKPKALEWKRENRAFFDNAHDIMTDVWKFPRVVGDERFGHATPKPVEMIRRAIKSSCPPDGIVGEPFGGTGTTLVAAEAEGRSCYIAEIDRRFCDVILTRWENYTGEKVKKV